MNARTLTILCLVGVALLGIGYGLGRGGRDREAGVPGVSGAMKPVMPSGASPAAEQAERGEIREFVPVRPFAKGEAEAWLRGLKGKGWPASMRAFNTLDADAAEEVAAMIGAIRKRLDKEDGDTVAVWGSNLDKLLLESGLDVILAILAEQDPESAVASLNDLGNDKWDVRMVWAEIARHAPGRLEAMLATTAPELLPHAVWGSVVGLFGSDVEAGIALMMKYPGEEFDGIRLNAVKSLLKSNPRRAVALASELMGEGHLGSGSFFHTIDSWLEKDEAAARQWIGEHDGPGRDHARASLLGHDAARNPAAAVAEFEALRKEGVPDDALEVAVGSIAEALGEAGPQAALAWMETLPAGSLHDQAVFGLAEIWVKQDPEAASEWIATLPPGEQRDTGAWHLVDAIQKRDPAAALEWARNFSDEDSRRRLIAEVLEEWRGQDPEAAEAAALGLPEEDRPPGDR